MTSPRLRNNSQVSGSSILSTSSEEGPLYPGEERPLVRSTEGRGSLWQQYSLIEKNYQVTDVKQGVCCGNDKQRPWLLKLSFLLVVASGLLVVSAELRFSIYSSQKVKLTGGDQMLLPVSTYFNKRVDLSTKERENAEKLMLHVLPHKPEIADQVKMYSIGGSFYMSSWTYQYWGIHLLKGTTVMISVCADLHLQFYIIKSDNKLKRWSQEILYNNYDYHRSIHPQPNCETKSNFKSHLLTVSNTDIYYIVFSSSVGWRFLTKVYVILHFNRTYYNISKTKYSCSLTNESCYVNLDYGSRDIALVEAISSTADPPSSFHTIDVKYSPVPRWSFYLKLLGGIYLSVVIATTIYTIWRLYVNIMCTSEEEKQPFLSADQLQKEYTYSLRSTAGYRRNKDAWVVISPLARITSKEALYEIRERDSESVISGLDHEHVRRQSLLSHVSVSSRESLYMRSHAESALGDYMYRTQPYDNDQQLLDSCMTSAGVSAI